MLGLVGRAAERKEIALLHVDHEEYGAHLYVYDSTILKLG